MPKLQIRNHRTGAVLYDGVFSDARRCVEQAVRENVCLAYADLRHANLAQASLDDARLQGALLRHANLTGANISEALLSGADFSGATLAAACLCLSDLENCNFDAAQFGGTDIAGVRLDKARFSGLSAFTLNFADAGGLDNCLYRSSTGTVCAFSKPPLVLGGLPVPVVFMDRHLKIGYAAKTYREWLCHTNDNSPEDANSCIYDLIKNHADLFVALRETGMVSDSGVQAAA